MRAASERARASTRGVGHCALVCARAMSVFACRRRRVVFGPATNRGESGAATGKADARQPMMSCCAAHWPQGSANTSASDDRHVVSDRRHRRSVLPISKRHVFDRRVHRT
ncbi:uncharacterized protein LOC144099386 [Amblyomma americanum]